MAAPAPRPPCPAAVQWAQQALGSAARSRPRALAAFPAFGFVPTRREGPPELSYFNRAPKLKYINPAVCQRLKQREIGRRCAHHMAGSQKFLPFNPLADSCSLDCFTIPEGYDQYLPCCERKHAKGRGLNIHEEEMARPVPLLSSSDYGKRVDKPLDPPTKEHTRADHLHAAIYGENGRTRSLKKPSPSLAPC